MCGRFYRRVSWTQYRDRLPLVSPTTPQNYAPEWDARPTTSQLVARPVAGGVELVPLRWGLVPFWTKGPLKGFKMTTFNARAEGLANSPAFREPFKRRRALCPVSGWYEWVRGAGETCKTQLAFRPADDELLMLAALWDRAHLDDGVVESFTIVTAPPGSALSTYHDRAPVVVQPKDWDAWLDPAAATDQLLAVQGGEGIIVEEAAALWAREGRALDDR